MIFATYTFLAFDFTIALLTSSKSKFEQIDVYKEPGPNTIIFAFFIASITSGTTFKLPSFKNICFIGDLVSLTLSLMFSFPTTTSPFSSPAQSIKSSVVTGYISPCTWNISDSLSIDFGKLPVISVNAFIIKLPIDVPFPSSVLYVNVYCVELFNRLFVL